MKPTLDRMVDLVVSALSGKAKAFYDLEFDFFNEVTSISGKLKPFIKKSKPEKKVSLRSTKAIVYGHLMYFLRLAGQNRRRDGEN
jgi:phosphatidylinositol 4-kinase